MGDDDLRLVAKPVDARENRLAEFRMPFDDDPLLGIERARLAQDRVGDPNLADVVQQPGAGQRSQRVVRELHRPPDLYRELRDPQVVTSRVLIACLDRGGQRRDGVDMFEFGADLDLELQGRLDQRTQRLAFGALRCHRPDGQADTHKHQLVVLPPGQLPDRTQHHHDLGLGEQHKDDDQDALQGKPGREIGASLAASGEEEEHDRGCCHPIGIRFGPEG